MHRYRQMQKHRSNRAPAFTIIELLVAATIGLIVSGVITAILISTWRTQIAQEAYTQLQLKSRNAADEIANQVKSAATVVTSVSLGGNTYTTSASVLVIRTASLDADNNILPGSDYFVFRRNPTTQTQLQRLIFADASSARATILTPLVLNDSTSALTFTYFDAAGSQLTPGVSDITTSESVNVSVTSAKTVNGRSISRQIDAKAFLRNN